MIRKLTTSLSALGMCVWMLGCGTGPTDEAASQNSPSSSIHDHGDGHDHDAAGPHGGHVIVLGNEEYHAELTHDEASHTVAVYLLDGAIENVVSDGPAEVGLQVFKDGDFVDHVLNSSGEAGLYSLADAALCEFLLHTAEVKGRIRAEIAGTQYVGVLEHTAHAHAGHDHGDGGVGHGHDRDEDGAGEEHMDSVRRGQDHEH